ncbi:Rpp20 subunit of nuclear RNase MRP and P-domain-containing protein [Aspergillus desertorum]
MRPQTKVQNQSQDQAQTNLADLHFERKNQDMVKLPKYARITKRPIPHPPVSSPYAGPSIPKTIYVSSSTPYMSAVKRVQKLLLHAEKRAITSLANKNSNNKNKSSGKNASQKKLGEQEQGQLIAAITRGEDREQLEKEEVFVKATGKAMKIALRVGKWFGSHGREGEYRVRVSTGAVLVVDDVEEDELSKEGFLYSIEKNAEGKEAKAKSADVDMGVDVDVQGTTSANEGDDTTLLTTTTGVAVEETTIMTGTAAEKVSEPTPATKEPKTESKPLSKSALRKRKRAASLAASLAETELPESRTRWVNSVEVAVSLK